jgi:hypothetical protein
MDPPGYRKIGEPFEIDPVDEYEDERLRIEAECYEHMRRYDLAIERNSDRDEKREAGRVKRRWRDGLRHWIEAPQPLSE